MVKNKNMWWIIGIVVVIIILSQKQIEEKIISGRGFSYGPIGGVFGRSGMCTLSGYDFCFEERYSYEGANAYARITLDINKENNVFQEKAEIKYLCDGTQLTYYISSKQGDWRWNCNENGCSGEDRLDLSGLLSFTKEEAEALEKDVNGNSYIYFRCFDYDEDEICAQPEGTQESCYIDSWAWTAAGYYVTINAKDITIQEEIVEEVPTIIEEPDLCEGMECAPQCVGTTQYLKGGCIEGTCEYQTKIENAIQCGATFGEEKIIEETLEEPIVEPEEIKEPSEKSWFKKLIDWMRSWFSW